MNELTAMFSSLKLATDFLKGLSALKTDAAVSQAKVELNDIILSLQSNASSLQQKYDEMVRSKNELETKLTELRNFDSEKKKYELKNIITGVIAYVPKNEKDRVNDKHWLCQNCLDNFQRFTIYQVKKKYSVDMVYYCPNCNHSFTIKNPDYQEPSTSSETWLTR